MSRQPYHGLRPFQRDETDIFFGREQHTDELIERLGRQHFLAVVGYSGCGKSSLVRTGLIPSLQAGFLAGTGTHWQVAELRPGNRPFANLAQALADDEALGKDYSTALLDNRFLHRGSLSLHELLAIKPLPHQAKLLIVCDQFEEIFRYYEQGARAEAASFIKLLLASCQSYRLADGSMAQDVYVVLTMRSDFLGDCAFFAGLPEKINNGLYLTPRLTREQLREAIEEPALVFGGEVAPDLTVRLLQDAEHNPDQLPLLQHALMILWQKAAKQTAKGKTIRLTVPLYEEIGTLQQALSNHADAVFAKDLSAEQQMLAEKLFKALSERGGGQRDTRRPQKLSALAELTQVRVDALMQVIEVFRHSRQCFLMPPEGTPLHEDSVIDISHESFIRQWKRLKAWVEEEAAAADKYQRLVDHALRHAQGQAALLQSPELEIMQQWSQQFQPTAAWAARYTEEAARGAEQSGSELFQLAIDFLRRSRQQARLRKSLFVLAFVGMSALAGLASWEWYVADMHRQRAETAEKEAVQAKNAAQLSEKQAKQSEQDAIEAKNAALLAKEQAKKSEELAQQEKKQTEYVNQKLAQFAKSTINSLANQDLKIVNEYIDDIFKAGLRDVFIALLKPLTTETESMGDDERQYWNYLLPRMTDAQVKRLVEILFTERVKLAALEMKYQKKISKANEKHLKKWIDAQIKGVSKDRPETYLGTVNIILENFNKYKEINIDNALQLLKEYKKIPSVDITKTYYLYGRYYQIKGDKKQAKSNYIKAVEGGATVDELKEIFSYFTDDGELHLALKAAEKIANQARGKLQQDEKQSDTEVLHDSKIAYLKSVGRVLQAKARLKDNALPPDIEHAVHLAEKIKQTDLSDYLFFQEYLASFYNKIGDSKKSAYILSKSLSHYESSKHKNEIKKSWIAREYGNLSWYQLFAKQPQAAIVSAQKGLEYDPEEKWIKINLAHGYLLSGQICEAEKIHSEMRNKKIKFNDEEKTWNEAVSEDFNVFTEKGITHPDMKKIKKLLETGQLSPECAATTKKR